MKQTVSLRAISLSIGYAMVILSLCTSGVGLQGAPPPPEVTADEDDKTGTPRALHFCIDNSGSMGQNANRAKTQLAKLLNLATEPSSFVVFSCEAQRLSNKLCKEKDMTAIQLPAMGRTNITAGLEASVDEAIKAERSSKLGPGVVHHVLILLTDGDHNVGTKPEEGIPRIAAKLRKNCPGIKFSVVVIGVSSSSKTQLGMVAKTQLETTPIDGIKPIYFCKTASEMEAMIREMQAELEKVDQVRFAEVESPGDFRFVRDPADEPIGKTSVLVDDKIPAVMLIKGGTPEVLLVDGVEVKVDRTGSNASNSVTPEDAEFLIRYIKVLMDRLKERRVTFTGRIPPEFFKQVENVKFFIGLLSQLLERMPSPKTGPASSGVTTPAIRLQRIRKKTAAAINTTQELLNQLEAIKAFSSDDSASQAAFLTGATQKFAAKALIRSKANGNSGGTEALVQEARRVAAALPAALRCDTLMQLGRLSEEARDGFKVAEPELLAAAAAAADSTDPAAATALAAEEGPIRGFLDTELPAALDAHSPPNESWLSLLSQRDQLLEWVAAFGEGAGADGNASNIPGTEYELLTYVGMLGVPIDVRRCAATQMSPYQHRVARVWPSAIDTGSMLCALECGEQVRAPEGGEPEDVLPLIDPALPHATRLVARSAVMDTLASVTLARDLNMFLGNEYRMASHAHALLAAVDPDGPPSLASATLALRLMYSARKHLGRSAESDDGRYPGLLRKLFGQEGLTEADGVDHMMQVALALAVCDRAALGLGELDQVALLNLANETLARAAKLELKSDTDGSVDAMKRAAHARAAVLLGVTEADAPQPTGVEEPEPARDAIREQCDQVRPGYALTAESKAATARWCHGRLAGLFKCVAFGEAVQRYAAANGGMASVMAEIEAGATGGGTGELAAAVLAAIATPPPLAEVLGLGPAGKDRDRTLATMEAQAVLCHSSALRSADELGDVRDPATLHLIAVERRLEFYDGMVTVKMAEWAKIAGDVTLRRAMMMNDLQFQNFINRVHSFSKDEFWALAAYAKRKGGEKEKAFVDECNTMFFTGRKWNRLPSPK